MAILPSSNHMNLPASRFHALDGLRGIAAFIIMLFHYLEQDLPRFLSHGYLAVDLFFILSGFVICHAYTGRMQSGMTNGQLINRRLARLVPTVIIGVILAGIATLIRFSQTGQVFNIPNFLIAHTENLFIIPASVDYKIPPRLPVLVFPSNPPLWSILFELAASIGFVWFVHWNNRKLLAGWLICFALFVMGCIYVSNLSGSGISANVGWNQANFIYGFPRAFGAFLCGMLIYRLTQNDQHAWRQHFVGRGAPLMLLALYALTCSALMFPFYAKGVYQFAAILFLFPVIIAIGSVVHVRQPWLVATSAWLGEISFPLYAVHKPAQTLSSIFLTFFGLDDLPSEAILTVRIVFALIIATLVLKLLNALKAGNRVSKALKPITG